MTNITKQLCEPVMDYMNQVEWENGISMYSKVFFPGRRQIYIITELGWQDQLFLPIRLQLLKDI